MGGTTRSSGRGATGAAARATVVLPLFDRLLQGDNIETDINAERAMRAARESVRRDLEILLNTRPCHLAIPAGLDELHSSLIGYGLPELPTQQMGSPSQQETFRQRLEAIIRRFEPRLRELSVEIVEPEQALADRTLRFRIQAVLHVAASTEIVVYDTFVDPVAAAIAFAHGAQTT